MHYTTEVHDRLEAVLGKGAIEAMLVEH